MLLLMMMTTRGGAGLTCRGRTSYAAILCRPWVRREHAEGTRTVAAEQDNPDDSLFARTGGMGCFTAADFARLLRRFPAEATPLVVKLLTLHQHKVQNARSRLLWGYSVLRSPTYPCSGHSDLGCVTGPPGNPLGRVLLERMINFAASDH
jgi:hypothetical protein